LNARDDGYIYSLPTEAEWEYAARSGTTGDYAGDLDSMAWYGNNSGNSYLDAGAIWKTDQSNYGKRILANGTAAHPVGQKQPNAFGLYDMHGNVWEWCEDIYNDKGYSGSPTDGSANVSVGDTSKRVLRGGSWAEDADGARSALRGGKAPSSRVISGGFRVLARLR
jgi:eukaryotic-like serine/threonine-protein kinase